MFFTGFNGYKMDNIIGDILQKRSQTRLGNIFGMEKSNFTNAIKGNRGITGIQNSLEIDSFKTSIKNLFIDFTVADINKILESIRNSLNNCTDDERTIKNEKNQSKHEILTTLVTDIKELLEQSSSIDQNLLKDIVYSIFSFYLSNGEMYIWDLKQEKTSSSGLDEVLRTCRIISAAKLHNRKNVPITKYTFLRICEYLCPEANVLSVLHSANSAMHLNSLIQNTSALLPLKEEIKFYTNSEDLKGDDYIYVSISQEATFITEAHKTKALNILLDSYMSCVPYFHNSYSKDKHEINVTVSKYINALAFEGYFSKDYNSKCLLLEIAEKLISTHNHDNDYIHTLVEQYNGNSIIAAAQPSEELSNKIIELIECYYTDVTNTDCSFCYFTSKFIDWIEQIDKNDKGFVINTYKRLIENKCFDPKIWNKVSREYVVKHFCEKILDSDDKKILCAYITMYAKGEAPELFRFLNPKYRDKYLKFLHRAIIYLDSYPTSSHKTLCQGIDSCLSGIYIYIRSKSDEEEKYMPIIKDILFSVDWSKKCYSQVLINCKDWILNGTPKLNFNFSYDWYELVNSCVTSPNNDANNINCLLYGLDPMITQSLCHDENKNKEVIQLYNESLLFLTEYLYKKETYSDAFRTVILCRRNYVNEDVLCKIREFTAYALSKHDYEMDYICIEKCVKDYMNGVHSDEEKKNLLLQIFLHLPDYRFKDILSKYKLLELLTKNRQVLDCIVEETIKNNNTFIRSIQYLVEEKNSIEESPNRKAIWEYVFIFPILHKLLWKDNFLKLDRNLQIQLFHFCKKHKEYESSLLYWLQYVENNDTAFNNDNAVKFALLSYCDKTIDIDSFPNIKNYLITIADDIASRMPNSKEIKEKYGYYTAETFMYHLISLLKKHPEDTALLCACCISKAYGTLKYISDHPNDKRAQSKNEDRSELFSTVISNPCIRTLASHYAKEILDFIKKDAYDANIFKSYVGENYDKNETLMKNMEFGIYPKWFEKKIDVDSVPCVFEENEIVDYFNSDDAEDTSNEGVLKDLLLWEEEARQTLNFTISPTNRITILKKDGISHIIHGNKLLKKCIYQAEVDEVPAPKRFMAYIFHIEELKEELVFPKPLSLIQIDLYEVFEFLYKRVLNILSIHLGYDISDSDKRIPKIPKQHQKDELITIKFFLDFYRTYVSKHRLIKKAALGYKPWIDEIENAITKLENKMEA